MDCSTPGFPVLHQLPELAQTHVTSVTPSNHLILCRPLLLLPSVFPSIRVFSSWSVLRIRWPKYWSFGFSISPSNEYSGLISFRMDWLDLLAVQGTLKSLLQHHSSRASILQHSAFFIVQLSHPYITTGKTIAAVHGVAKSRRQLGDWTTTMEGSLEIPVRIKVYILFPSAIPVLSVYPAQRLSHMWNYVCSIFAVALQMTYMHINVRLSKYSTPIQ